MNPIPRILAKVTREPWAIIPENLEAIALLLERHHLGIESAAASSVLVGRNDRIYPAPKSVSVVPVFGIIGQHLSSLETMCGATDVLEIASTLEEAASNGSTESILLYVNSPGGTVTGVPELSNLIRTIDQKKPVIAFTDSMMGSAAYWLGSSARTILATPSARVGSIGVYAVFKDMTQAMASAGIKVNVVSAGKFKVAGAPFKEMTTEERAMFQDRADRFYGQFKSAVTSRRQVDDSKMQGQVFDGEEAMDFGLVDDLVLSLGDAVAYAAQLTSIPQTA